jgi:hypothetical protein
LNKIKGKNIKIIMAKRIVIKFGDIFVIKFDEYQKYFQYIANDMTMLNSRVIRTFKKNYLYK